MTESLSPVFRLRRMGLTFDNRISIHQIHSHSYCESMSQDSVCAMICSGCWQRKVILLCFWLAHPLRGARTVCYERRMVTSAATTGYGVKDTPVQSQSERAARFHA